MADTFCMKDQDVRRDNDTDCNSGTLTGRLMNVWTSQPHKDAIIFYDENNTRTSVTNNELRILCEKFAAIVRSKGIKKGDVACNFLAPGIEKQVAMFGLMLAGVVVMDGSCIDDTVETCWRPLEQANVKAIILDSCRHNAGWNMFQDQVGRDTFVETYFGKRSTPVEKIFVFRVASHQCEQAPFAPTVRPALEILGESQGRLIEKVTPEDPCHLFVERCPYQRHYKLVARNHGEFCILAERHMDMLQNIQSSDIIYTDWPLTWLARLSFCYVLKGCTMVKSTLVFQEAKSVVRETWDLICKEKCTMAGIQPDMIHMLESHCHDLPEPHWRLKAITTNYHATNTIIDAIGVVTNSIIICYSLIETGMISRYIIDEHNKGRFVGGCVGHIHSDITTTHFDLTCNRTPKPKEIGEMVIKGTSVTKEYYNDDNLTKASFTKDGSFKTGDLGYYDAEGHIVIVGAIYDAIIHRSAAVFPHNIENMLNMCPGIWKVKVVAVKGAKEICACVVPRTEDSLTIRRVKEFCRYMLGSIDENDEKPEMPEYVVFFGSFPYHNGQVQRQLLAKLASGIIEAGGTRHSC